MTGTLKKLIFVAFIACGILLGVPNSAPAAQEVKEIFLISSFLGESHANLKKIHRLANEMKSQARPFSSKRHRDRYRFEPGDKIPREIMSLSRKMSASFKMINGVLHQSDVKNKEIIFKQFFDATDSLSTFCKRAIRANRDNNYALYLASAQAIEKEVAIGNDLLNDLEIAINNSIAESDARKESL